MLATVFCVLTYYESIYFLTLVIGLLGWLLFKKVSGGVIIAYVCYTAFFMFYLTMFFEANLTAGQHETSQHFTLVTEPKINGSMMRGFMKDEAGLKFYYVYEIPSEAEKNKLVNTSLVGLQIEASGTIAEVTSAHRYSFEMENYLRSKQAVGPFEITQMKSIAYEQSFMRQLATQRFRVKQYIEKVFPTSLVAEAQALLIGDQDGVDVELERAYQKLGITHLFAISGLHIALLSYLFYETLIRCRIRKEIAYTVLIVLLPLYALLAGGAPSVWRAVMIVLLIALFNVIKIKWPIADILSISGIVYLFLSPYVLFEVGFQLSYLATFSIIYSSQLLQRQSNSLLQNFYLTFVCQLLTYPLLLFHFYEVSLSSFFANILFVPLFSFVILPINLLLLIVSFLSTTLSNPLLSVYETLRNYLTDFILFLQQIPYQMWIAGKPSLIWILFLYCSVLLSLYILDVGKRKSAIFLTLLIPALLFSFRHYAQSDLQITYINVGQGDSILVELPRREAVYLIDTGGLLRFETEQWKARNELYEVGRQVVVPYLKGKGISSIDVLILTHADADHVEGADELLKEIHVKEIHVTPNSIHNATMNDLLKEATDRNIKIFEKYSGHNWQIGGIQFMYLSPFELEYEGNNDSLVLLMQQGNFKALFTGDLEEAGELELIKQYPTELKNITILKAGHHGSKTSSAEAFLTHTGPRLTIFTAGKDNRYKHPSKEVIERMNALQLPYVVTGLDGTIEITIRNDVIRFNKWNKKSNAE